MTDCYSQWIQNFLDMASEDGQPDEAKEYEDLEGIEQNIYPDDDEPLRIHNTDSETDAVMVAHEQEAEHMKQDQNIKVEIDPEHEHLLGLIQKQDQISSETDELFRDKKKDPRMYCIWCGKVSTPLLCLSCRTKTIRARIEQRLNSP